MSCKTKRPLRILITSSPFGDQVGKICTGTKRRKLLASDRSPWRDKVGNFLQLLQMSPQPSNNIKCSQNWWSTCSPDRPIYEQQAKAMKAKWSVWYHTLSTWSRNIKQRPVKEATAAHAPNTACSSVLCYFRPHNVFFAKDRRSMPFVLNSPMCISCSQTFGIGTWPLAMHPFLPLPKFDGRPSTENLTGKPTRNTPKFIQNQSAIHEKNPHA